MSVPFNRSTCTSTPPSLTAIAPPRSRSGYTCPTSLVVFLSFFPSTDPQLHFPLAGSGLRPEVDLDYRPRYDSRPAAHTPDPGRRTRGRRRRWLWRRDYGVLRPAEWCSVFASRSNLSKQVDWRGKEHHLVGYFPDKEWAGNALSPAMQTLQTEVAKVLSRMMPQL